MEPSPQKLGLQFLPQVALETKFDELDMLGFLNITCSIHSIEIPQVTTLRKKWKRWNDWRGAEFRRDVDGIPQAALYWRKTVLGEDRKVQWFIAPDGTHYAADNVQAFVDRVDMQA